MWPLCSAMRLYWVDAFFDKIEHSNFDGQNRISLDRIAQISHPFGLTVFEGNTPKDSNGMCCVNIMDKITEILLFFSPLSCRLCVLHRLASGRHRPCAQDWWWGNGHYQKRNQPHHACQVFQLHLSNWSVALFTARHIPLFMHNRNLCLSVMDLVITLYSPSQVSTSATEWQTLMETAATSAFQFQTHRGCVAARTAWSCCPTTRPVLTIRPMSPPRCSAGPIPFRVGTANVFQTATDATVSMTAMTTAMKSAVELTVRTQ